MSPLWALSVQHLRQGPIYQKDSEWCSPDWSTSKSQSAKISQPDVCHAEAFELTLWDQTAMTDTSDIATIWMSMYCRQKRNKTARTNRGNIDTSTTATHNNNVAEQETCQVFIGCGSHQHGTPRTNACHLTCPVWSQTCNTCGKPNHFLTVCWTKKEHCRAVIKDFEDEEAPMNTLWGGAKNSECCYSGQTICFDKMEWYWTNWIIVEILNCNGTTGDIIPSSLYLWSLTKCKQPKIMGIYQFGPVLV